MKQIAAGKILNYHSNSCTTAHQADEKRKKKRSDSSSSSDDSSDEEDAGEPGDVITRTLLREFLDREINMLTLELTQPEVGVNSLIILFVQFVSTFLYFQVRILSRVIAWSSFHRLSQIAKL